ncbi:MAG: 2-amino-4-hydroxy-6-hydroxymethyldihydropteridine diphosphokinase [Candidatus Sulfotelmatobacter sp.]
MDTRMGSLAYLSLGSNIGDREKHLREAISRLEKPGRIIAVSSFYETAPVEYTQQSWFLNCAVKLETSLTAPQLLTDILKIEREMGRQRTQRKGPRTIDIDILLFGDTAMETPELTIPHPSMAARRFVLEPLAEIEPEMKHPVWKKTVKKLLLELPSGQITRRIDTGQLPAVDDQRAMK